MDETINILVLNDISRSILRFLARGLTVRFDSEVKISRHMIIPSRLFNQQKGQYDARRLLGFLTENMTIREVRGINLAVFDRDLFAGSLDFVFGLSSCFPRICVISLLRIHPHYGRDYFSEQLQKRKAGRFPLAVKRLTGSEKKTYHERILKEAVHGIGHTFGLTHCRDRSCIMYPSEDIGLIDGKGTEFCDLCRSDL